MKRLFLLLEIQGGLSRVWGLPAKKVKLRKFYFFTQRATVSIILIAVILQIDPIRLGC